MSRTINHNPYDVQMRAAWGDTEPLVDIDPLTGEAWARFSWKGARADRVAKGKGTVEHVPGARIGGNNPAKHREYLGRPRIAPEVSEWDDDPALAAWEQEQRYLDELSRDLHSGMLDHDGPGWDECDFCGGPCVL